MGQQPRKKKKRKKKRYLLKLTILVALSVGAYFFLTSEFFDIQKIEVADNSYYTNEQVISIAGAKTGDNLFESKTIKMRDKLLEDPYIKSAKVKRKLPDTLVITVEERQEYAAVVEENVVIPQEPEEETATGEAIADGSGGTDIIPVGTDGAVDAGLSDGAVASGTDAAVGGQEPQVDANGNPITAPQVDASGNPITTPQVDASGNAIDAPQVDANGNPIGAPAATPQAPVIGTLYVILDKDGLVLRTTDTAPAVPLIQGLTVKKAEPGKALKVEENLMFTDTLSMIAAMNKQEVFFKKIVVTPVVVKAYVYDSLLCEGTPENIKKNMAGLKALLYELYTQNIQRGVIKVGSDNYMPFSPRIDE